MYTFYFFLSNGCNKNIMILIKTLQPLSNLFKLENIKLYMNFSFFCLISLIYLVFADFLSHGSHLTLLNVNLLILDIYFFFCVL